MFILGSLVVVTLKSCDDNFSFLLLLIVLSRVHLATQIVRIIKLCRFIDICILQAKRSIAFYWKKMEKPPILQWTNNISFCLSMEKITYILKGKLSF